VIFSHFAGKDDLWCNNNNNNNNNNNKHQRLDPLICSVSNTLVLPTFLYGSENWTVTGSQRRRIEAAEMKLLRPLAGYTLYD